MSKPKQFVSVLGPFIQQFIAEKRALGYSYDTEECILSLFDRYWIEKGNKTTEVTQDSLSDWLEIKPGYSMSYQRNKTNVVKFLTIYMNSLGIPCYVPLNTVYAPKPIVHVLNNDELRAFFHQVDTSASEFRCLSATQRCIEMEYPVIFRLVVTCGLRNNEACSIRLEDVNFSRGTMEIMNAKGHKDRRVFLSEDMREYLQEYWEKTKKVLGYQPYWLFPGKKDGDHIKRCAVENRFQKYWNATPYAGNVEKRPTVHCLRHTFTVLRINQWLEQGMDFKMMMPYLSKFLGHKSYQETFYYYHMVEEAFEIIHKYDKTGNAVLPGVRR